MGGNYDTNAFGGMPDIDAFAEPYEGSPAVVLAYQDKLRLLKSIVLLKNMSERTIQGLAEFLKPRKVPDGTVVFEEGQPRNEHVFRRKRPDQDLQGNRQRRH